MHGFLLVQWLRLHASIAQGSGLLPGTKIQGDARYNQKYIYIINIKINFFSLKRLYVTIPIILNSVKDKIKDSKEISSSQKFRGRRRVEYMTYKEFLIPVKLFCMVL